MVTGFLNPDLSPPERTLAQVEGWIFGVTSKNDAGRGLKSATSRSGTKMTVKTTQTTVPGYVNKNGQKVLRKTDELGNDHNQRVYVLECGNCSNEYGANGSDIWLRRCPACQGGTPGLATER